MSVSERDIEVCMAYYTDGEQVACVLLPSKEGRVVLLIRPDDLAAVRRVLRELKRYVEDREKCFELLEKLMELEA